MSIEELFSKRRQIRAAWDPNRAPSKEMIYDLLKRTQKISPSKQNVYPFKIHAFGPNDEKERDIISQICCLFAHGAVNDFDVDRDTGDRILHKKAPWVLVFELRKCKPNTFIKDHSKEFNDWTRFTQVDERFRESSNRTLAAIEVGMYCKILAGLCLENDLAISYIKSFPEWTWKGQRNEYSKNKNNQGLNWDSLPQITEAPLLVVQIGYKADMEDLLSSTVEVDGIIHSTKGGLFLEDKPSIDEILQFKD